MNNQCSIPNAHFRLLFQAAPSPFLVLLPDQDFTIADANDEYLRQTLTVREEIIGKGIFEIFPDNPQTPEADATKNLRASLLQVVATKTAHTMAFQRYDVPARNKSGFESRYWSPINVPVLADDGSLLYILHRVENVTDYVQSIEANEALKERSALLQAELRESEAKIFRHVKALSATNSELQKITENAREWQAGEAKFRMITDALPQIVWTALPNGVLDYFNRQFFDFTGVPNGDATGDVWPRLLHPDDSERAAKSWKHSIATGEPFEIMYRLRDRTGEYKWILARALPVRDEQGAIFKWIGATTDIHAKVLAEEVLRDADKRKDEFLAMLAHELRNPLAPISAAADLLAMARTDNPQINRVSDIIRRQVGHVTSLVNDLLDVSRVTQGLVTLDRKVVDLKQVVQDAAEQARPLIEERKHHLSLHLAPDFACVCGDQKRLVQVLSNLLNNAAKYTPDGGHINLTMEVTPDEVTICVSDDGIGMKPELLRNVFDLFLQGERTADRVQGGLGIGLALVKSLVEQHHGTVTAASKGPGRGSSMLVRLPRVARAPEPVAVAAPAADHPLKKMRILVVDDNIDAGETTGMILQKFGNDVVVEYGAESALARARREPFDMYMLDIGLPGMDGYELARQIRDRPESRRAVFVALTGYGQEQDRRTSAEAGFVRHFVKPVGMHDLQQLFSDMSPHA